MNNQIVRQQEEIDRLREALRRIAYSNDYAFGLQAMALEALNGEDV